MALSTKIRLCGNWRWICRNLVKTSRNASTNISDNSTDLSSSKKLAVVQDGKVKVSKAMKAYLLKKQEHEEFMKNQVIEFEIGKRHLANIMGEDPNTFTQDDIDRAIEYLLPSGLLEPRARPILKHPDLLFQKTKEAEFDITGRPYHFLFYTKLPNYFSVLYNIAESMQELNDFEDTMIAKGIKEVDPHERINFDTSQWMNKKEMEKQLLENLLDTHYEYLIECLKTLLEHPYSHKLNDFLMKYRSPINTLTVIQDIPQVKFDENGRPFMDAEGQRKKAFAYVVVYGDGTGQIKINDTDITYFPTTQSREQVLFPLQFTDLADKVDLEIQVADGGVSTEAGAIRYATSVALRSFVSADMAERMRLAGLLTQDPRMRERQKVGQRGARAKYKWKKR